VPTTFTVHRPALRVAGVDPGGRSHGRDGRRQFFDLPLLVAKALSELVDFLAGGLKFGAEAAELDSRRTKLSARPTGDRPPVHADIKALVTRMATANLLLYSIRPES
jgi:hypothetical protein